MLTMIRKLQNISGTHSRAIWLMVLCNLAKSIFAGISLLGISFLIYSILHPNTLADVAILALIMVVSVVGKSVFSYYGNKYKNMAAYGMGEENRLAIGDRLRQLNMGYFNNNSLGTIAGGLTTVISNLESTGFYIIERTISSVMQAIIITACVFAFDWKTGLIMLVGLFVSMIVNLASQKKIDKLTQGLQESRLSLDEAMLEFVQGMGIVKAFGGAQQAFSKIRRSISNSHSDSYAIEKALAPVQSLYIIVLKFFPCLILLFTAYRFYSDSVSLTIA